MLIGPTAKRPLSFGAAAVVGLGLAGCSPPAPPVNLYRSMVEVVAPQAQVIWDVSNKGTNDEGEPDPAKLASADWVQLVAASQALRDSVAALAEAKQIHVVDPGEKIQSEGTPGGATGAQVQQLIDKDPAEFARQAKLLLASADALQAASSAKDANKLLGAAGELDAICEGCHVKFWYPQEAAALANAGG